MNQESGCRPYAVLVVDDEAPERMTIQDLIRSAVPDCEITGVSSDKEAKEVLKTHPVPFDLAVVDVRLLNNNEGLKLLGKDSPIRNRSAQTRVLVYTALARFEIACAAYEAGADACLSKGDPDSHKKLREKARELLELREAREDLRMQYERQMKAEQYLRSHPEVLEKYADQVLLLHDEDIIRASSDAEDLWKYMEEMVIVKAAQPRSNDVEC